MGRRLGGPEHTEPTHAWQFPQGGIDKGEDPYEAALRELFEETSIRSVAKLGEIDEWLTYDLPDNLVGKAWKGRYRGQKQRWFAFRFTGIENEIDIAEPGGGHKPEFLDWRWESLRNAPELVVPFKRPIYERLAHDFHRFAG